MLASALWKRVSECTRFPAPWTEGAQPPTPVPGTEAEFKNAPAKTLIEWSVACGIPLQERSGIRYAMTTGIQATAFGEALWDHLLAIQKSGALDGVTVQMPQGEAHLVDIMADSTMREFCRKVKTVERFILCSRPTIRFYGVANFTRLSDAPFARKPRARPAPAAAAAAASEADGNEAPSKKAKVASEAVMGVDPEPDLSSAPSSDAWSSYTKALKSQVADLSKKLSTRRRERDDLEDENIRLVKQLDDRKRANRRLLDKLDDERREKSYLEAEIEGDHELYNHLKATTDETMATAMRAYGKLSIKCETLESNLTLAHAKLGVVVLKNDELRLKVDAFDEYRKKAEAEIAALKKHSEELAAMATPTCLVCHDKRADVIFLSCGHITCCGPCTDELHNRHMLRCLRCNQAPNDNVLVPSGLVNVRL